MSNIEWLSIVYEKLRNDQIPITDWMYLCNLSLVKYPDESWSIHINALWTGVQSYPSYFLQNLEYPTRDDLHQQTAKTGWWFQPLWKIWKSIGMMIPNIWDNQKSSKPPTRKWWIISTEDSISLPHNMFLLRNKLQFCNAWKPGTMVFPGFQRFSRLQPFRVTHVQSKERLHQIAVVRQT